MENIFSHSPSDGQARAGADIPVLVHLDLERYHADTAVFNRSGHYFAYAGVSTGGALNESIRLAGTLLSILPLILLYVIIQRQFVESIEKTGITGE